MQDFDTLSKELMKGGKGKEIEQLANSPEGKKISGMVDGKALKNAVASGDSAAVSRILGQFLATDEGKSLAKTIGDRFGKK